MAEWVWWTERGLLAIGQWDAGAETMTPPTSASTAGLRIWFKGAPAALSSDPDYDDTVGIPTRFCLGLAYRTMYHLTSEPKLKKMYRDEWERVRREAMDYSYKGRVGVMREANIGTDDE